MIPPSFAAPNMEGSEQGDRGLERSGVEKRRPHKIGRGRGKEEVGKDGVWYNLVTMRQRQGIGSRKRSDFA